MTTQPRMDAGFYCLSAIIHMERDKVVKKYDSVNRTLMANRIAHGIELRDGTWEYPAGSPHAVKEMLLDHESDQLSDLEDQLWAITVGLEFEELYGISEMFERYIVGPGDLG